MNIEPVERAVSALVGGGVMLMALRRRRLSSLAWGVIGGALLERGLTGHCRVYGAFGIDTTLRRPATAVRAQQGYKVEQAIAVARPAEQLYQLWQRLEDLPSIMDHLVRVEVVNEKLSHWVAKGPLGTTIEWDSEVIRQEPNRMISWRSLPGSQVDTAGSVHFSPTADGLGTVVRVNLKYNPPAGKVGASLAAFLGEGLEQQLAQDLQRFKQVVESAPGAEITPVAETLHETSQISGGL